MNAFVYKKNLSILAVFLSIAVLLAACSPAAEPQVSVPEAASPAAAATAPVSSPAPVSRLAEVLDPDKYAGQFTIRMFNVELKDSAGKISSGDTMLLQSPDGVTMMIDAGYKETIPPVLAHFKKLGIRKLDYIVATHMHPDHIGGFPTVLDTLPVGKVLASKYTDFNFVNSKILMNTLKGKNMGIDTVKEGDTFQFGKDIKVEVLNPEDTDKIVFTDDPYSNQDLCNEQSVVLKMTYGNQTFLFTGDIQVGTELRLVEKYGDKLNADLLKSPHHGYATSSMRQFLTAVSPAVTLINNAGVGNVDVYQRYQSVGSKVYTTGLDGILLVASDGKEMKVVTEKDRKAGALKP